MTARLTGMSLGSAGGATEQPLDRDEPVVADIDAVLVHVERDVLGTHLVGHLLGKGADVVAAHVRVRERVLDQGENLSFSYVVQIGREMGARYDPRELNGQVSFALLSLPDSDGGTEASVDIREAPLL